MKYEWRKAEKALYFPKQIEKITVPSSKFVVINGQGDPNGPQFSQQIEALYTVSYTLRMGLKQGTFSNDPFEYTVYPLEGVWTTSDGSRNEGLNKDALMYRIMIRQPAIVTEAMFTTALKTARQKKANPDLARVTFESYQEGPAVQMMHLGSFDDEPASFAKLHAFIEAQGLTAINTMGEYQHREIYLSDFRRVAVEKRKTVLRVRVKD